MLPDALQPKAYSRSYLHRQVSPPETLVVKGGTIWARNGQWILPENARLPRNIQGSFTCRKSTTWDKRLYFPFEGRRAENFSPWKIRRLRPGLKPRTWELTCNVALWRVGLTTVAVKKQQCIMCVLLSYTPLSTTIIKIWDVAQQFCYGKCTSPATIKRK